MTLLAALRAHLDGGEHLTGLRPLTDGHANRTLLLEGLDRVLRAPPAGPPLLPGRDMADQHDVMRTAAGAVPVPAVHDLCTDASVVGFPFLVMDRVDGASTDWHAPDWMVAGGPALRASIGEQWIGAIAAIHRTAPPGGWLPRTPADEAAEWLALAREARAPARLLQLLDDLAERPGPSSGPATLVHGDVKLANFLWADGRLTGVLDWELAAAGEPLTDLGYLLGIWPTHPGERGQMPFTRLEGWWTRAELIAAWEEATGRSAAGVGRHEQLGMAKIGAILAIGSDRYATGASTDERLARWPRSLALWLDLIDERGAAAIR